ERVENRPSGLLVNVKYARNLLSHELRVRQPRQFGEPCTVSVPRRNSASNLQREPRLPNTAGANQCHQPSRSERFCYILALPFAANQAGECDRQIIFSDIRRRAPPRPRACEKCGGACFVEL